MKSVMTMNTVDLIQINSLSSRPLQCSLTETQNNVMQLAI